MNMSQIFTVASMAALAIVALLVFVAKSQKPKEITPLASLAFGFILAGILFGDDRILGYSLLGIGAILSVIDIVRLAKSGEFGFIEKRQ